MNHQFLIPLIFVIAAVAALIIFRQSKVAAVGFIFLCVAIAAFSTVGFLASFEPAETGSNLGFKIGYAGLFLAALTGMYRSGRRLFQHAA